MTLPKWLRLLIIELIPSGIYILFTEAFVLTYYCCPSKLIKLLSLMLSSFLILPDLMLFSAAPNYSLRKFVTEHWCVGNFKCSEIAAFVDLQSRIGISALLILLFMLSIRVILGIYKLKTSNLVKIPMRIYSVGVVKASFYFLLAAFSLLLAPLSVMTLLDEFNWLGLFVCTCVCLIPVVLVVLGIKKLLQ